MLLNVNGFKEVIRKATLNFIINTVQLKITTKKVKSKMISDDSLVITMLNVDNNIIPDIKKTDELEFNFIEPNQSVIPFLNLIEEDDIEISISNDKIILKSDNQKSKLFFCSPRIVRIFQRENIRDGIDFFTSFNITNEFINVFNKIKKIGSRFGKIYLNVENNNLIIETTDKLNTYSNSLKFTIANNIDINDLSLCFNYKNFVSMMSLINDNYEDFKINLSYIKDQNLGLLLINNNDSEKYYQISKIDIDS